VTTGVPDISVVLPAHNEAGNIAPMCATLTAILAPLGSYEIVFVDDGSKDGTLAALRAAAAADPRVRYVSFTRNFGHQPALRAGLRYSRGRGVVVMDSDFEHPPELIPRLVAAWRAGSRIVATRRDDAEADLVAGKRTTSDLYYRLLNAVGDVRIEPGSAGHGDSKYSLRRMIELAITGIAAHSVRPLRIAIWFALGFALLGLLLVAYSVFSFLFVPSTVTGWTSMMAAVAILGAAQLLVLGIIGEYVGRIFGETRRRPTYLIGETEAESRAENATAAQARPQETLHRTVPLS